MNFFLLTFLLVCSEQTWGDSFLSKFLRGRKFRDMLENNENDVSLCETITIMPRIALAVVGGATVKSKISAPYAVAIGEKLANGSISWFCGGSLISSMEVLTAAHCVISRNASVARLGSFSTKPKEMKNDYDISGVVIHPDFKITVSYNDIAILRLRERAHFSMHIKPICLPETDEETFERQSAKVIGWGAEEFGGEGSLRLKQVDVEVVSNSKCESDYKNSTIGLKIFPTGIKSQQLCAGSSTGGKDACQGDSGGPLVVSDERGITRQIGIVSTGAGCGFSAYPGIYTRVSSYVPWINDHLLKNTEIPENRHQPVKHSNPDKIHYRND